MCDDRRSEDRKTAERLYLEVKGEIKLVDIANKLNLSPQKIRKWKALDKWEAKLSGDVQKRDNKEVGRSTKKTTAKKQSKKSSKKVERSTSADPPRKRGGQPGNQNSKGHKGWKPIGQRHALKHGGYSAVYWDTLSEEEKEMIREMDTDPETILLESIRLYAVRERRLMILINKYRGMVTPDGKDISVAMSKSSRMEKKRVFDGTPEEQQVLKEEYDNRIREKIENGERLPGRDVQIYTETENKDMLIARLEDQLTRCQSAKNKAIAELASIQQARLEREGGNDDLVAAWVESLMGKWGDADG
mgnify:CR=1 FL=1